MTVIIFIIGLLVTACSFTGAVLICIQEDQDRADRLEMLEQENAEQSVKSS